MKCIKCGKEISGSKCNECGFDFKSSQLCFISPLSDKEVDCISAFINAETEHKNNPECKKNIEDIGQGDSLMISEKDSLNMSVMTDESDKRRTARKYGMKRVLTFSAVAVFLVAICSMPLFLNNDKPEKNNNGVSLIKDEHLTTNDVQSEGKFLGTEAFTVRNIDTKVEASINGGAADGKEYENDSEKPQVITESAVIAEPVAITEPAAVTESSVKAELTANTGSLSISINDCEQFTEGLHFERPDPEDSSIINYYDFKKGVTGSFSFSRELSKEEQANSSFSGSLFDMNGVEYLPNGEYPTIWAEWDEKGGFFVVEFPDSTSPGTYICEFDIIILMYDNIFADKITVNVK